MCEEKHRELARSRKEAGLKIRQAAGEGGEMRGDTGARRTGGVGDVSSGHGLGWARGWGAGGWRRGGVGRMEAGGIRRQGARFFVMSSHGRDFWKGGARSGNGP